MHRSVPQLVFYTGKQESLGEEGSFEKVEPSSPARRSCASRTLGLVPAANEVTEIHSQRTTTVNARLFLTKTPNF
jgi:hypothetical protein